MTATLLAAASRGDEDAFRQLVDPCRGELHAHCYRMLGSVHDAEDALQEALLRAWRGVGRFEGRSSFRSWLYTIATNACLRLIERRPKRVLPVGLGREAEPLAERLWLEPYPDGKHGLGGPEASYERRESVELAFVAALQLLPAGQRAVLVLREVLGFSAREVADTLDTTVASVNSALQRARKAVEGQLPERSQQATLRTLGDEAVRGLVDRYVAAWHAGDVTTIVEMLSADARFAMPPDEAWYWGRDAITEFLVTGPLTLRWRFVPVSASGQLAFGTYSWSAARECFVADAVDVLTLRGTEIDEVTAFRFPSDFPLFGLPLELR